MTIDQFIKNAITEDIGEGDLTSLACIPESATGRARLLVKEPGIAAGVELASQIFLTIDSRLRIQNFIEDGAQIKPGDEIFHISGSARSILKGERIVLNCMQRMSGIATQTHRIAELIAHTGCKVLDTRKTTPNFRVLEKWAVRIGGGVNHRFGLYDMVMIKDNHIDYAGGIKQAIEAVRDYLGNNQLNVKVEIEARSLQELEEILAIGQIDRIMLDNFSYSDLRTAVQRINKEFETEASGGITEETAEAYASCGVDYISVGALTHTVKSLDLSLKAF